MGSYLQENHQGTHSQIREVPKLHSNVLSEDFKIDFKTLSNTQQ